MNQCENSHYDQDRPLSHPFAAADDGCEDPPFRRGNISFLFVPLCAAEWGIFMASLWHQTVSLPKQPALKGDLHTEVAVLGGGMAGVLTAFLLSRQGRRVVVLEAGRVAGGQTGNTTAKVTAQHGAIYHKLSQQNENNALLYAEANRNAINAYQSIIQQEQISCEWERVPALIYTKEQLDTLEQELQASKKAGCPVQFVHETSLPFPVKGAVQMDDQAQFHPLKLIKSILSGLTIYENTRALNVEGDEIHTPNGTVKAEHIVFTTHFPFLNFPGAYFMRLHQERSYVIALRGAGKMNGMYYGIDPDGLSFRNSGNFLLLGGGSHRTGENPSGGQYAALLQSARSFWPDCAQETRWSAQDCVPLDGIPYIGSYAESRPNWYVATGFQKWGMTTSMVAAQLITDAICQVENPYVGLFTPQRFSLSAAGPQLVSEGAHAVRGLSRELFSFPDEPLKELPPLHGGVIEWQGKKLGAFRDKDGTVYLVDTRCPHLGCQLAWNPEEHTWDCPCHGSRFDIHGRLISGPAQEDLAARTLHSFS